MTRWMAAILCVLPLLLASCGGGSGSQNSFPGVFKKGGAHGQAGVAAGPTKEQPRLLDARAARRVKRTRRELRPENTAPNHRVPTAAELAAFRIVGTVSNPQAVTGKFKGTTDEILQWGARKWGLDPNVVRAVAYVETRWRMSFVGDNGQSLGIMQVKSTVHFGTKPLSQKSTAFNVDYWGAAIRDYLDGRCGWLNDVEHGQPYAPGDLWGSIGAWYAGRWHTPEAEHYIAEVKHALATRAWLHGF